METLVIWINQFWAQCEALIKWTFDLLIDVIRYAVTVTLDGFLLSVGGIFEALDLGSYVVTYAGQWVHLPAPMIYLINAVQIPQALTMIAGAYGIRWIINLIPVIRI